MIPRSVRNNNPLNIDLGADWRGQMPPAQMTIDQQEEPRFVVFESPEWGFRAAAKIMLSYAKRDVRTIRQVITRWAPPSENDTSAYVMAVARDSAIGPDLNVDLSTRAILFPLLKAMTKHETGVWSPYWTDDQLKQGLTLAGVNSHG